MAQSGSGQSDREGISLIQVLRMFPNNKAAEAWFAEQRWPDQAVSCPRCESDSVQIGTTHPRMPYRCRACRKFFSVRTGSVMERSKLGYQTWAVAIFLLNTGIKGTSSMKLHRDLGIGQKVAWYLAHRIREAWATAQDVDPFGGPVEVDETFVAGKAANKREKMRRSDFAKAPVVRVRDRVTGRVSARPVEIADGEPLRAFGREHTRPGAQVYSAGHSAYTLLGGEYKHGAVQHSAGPYVIGDTHTNAIESFWSMFKRGYIGTYHRRSPKHFDRYVAEFAGRHHTRLRDTLEQMARTTRGLVGKQLPYAELIA